MTTSRLTPELIPLDKGLNLQAAKIVAEPGSVLDSLNYEQVDFMGQKRIDGFVRYDGSLGSYQDVFYRLFLTNPAYAVATVVYHSGAIVGVVVYGSDDVVDIAVIDQNYIPQAGDVLSIGTVASVEELKESETPADQYEAVLRNNQTLRERTTELPGPIAGLHWFNDRLYAVASVSKVEADSGYMPNDDYSGYPVLAVDGNYIYIGSTIPGDTSSDIASLFQSRTEQQALDELGDAEQYGWEFVHQGWEVPFEEGVSLYGSLVALNQNRQGVGVQGPTSIAGNNGKPLVLTQKVNISNLPVQVNGWKTSDSRTTYNLDVNALNDVDDWTIYADAFFSWDGESGVVSSTGIHSGALVEYIPNNSVEVEV